MSGASRGAGEDRGRRKEGDDRWPRAGSDRVATVTCGRWAMGSTTDAWARARGEGSEARASGVLGRGSGTAGWAGSGWTREGAGRCGLGRENRRVRVTGWAGAGLSLFLGLFSVSLFLILKQSNIFEFK